MRGFIVQEFICETVCNGVTREQGVVMGMHKKAIRLFVAIPMPRVVQEEVVRIQKKVVTSVPSACFVTPGQLHSTLVFIGEVPVASVSAIDNELVSIEHEPFSLTLGPLDFFAVQGQRRAIVFCRLVSTALTVLADKVATAVVPWMKNDRGAFVGHVTVARMPRDVNRVEIERVCQKAVVDPVTFTVDHFVLYQARLTPEGSVYTVTNSYILD